MFLIHDDLDLLAPGEQAVAVIRGDVADDARMVIVGHLDQLRTDADDPSHRARGQMFDAEVRTDALFMIFEEVDEDSLPEVSRPDLLESEQIGYSAILGQPGTYLVWSVDDEGNRHYYVLEETSDYFIRIKDIADANLEARRELDESNPYLGLLWAGAKTVLSEIVTLGCGIGTAATIIEAPPVGAIFGTCTLGAAAYFGVSVGEFIGIVNSIRAYDIRTEDDRAAIEGIFREIDADPSL